MTIRTDHPASSSLRNRMPEGTLSSPARCSSPRVRGIGTGAIAAPMATMFREEKLGLRAWSSLNTEAPDGAGMSGSVNPESEHPGK